LIQIQKNRKAEEMAEQPKTEQTNMVWLAGVLKLTPKRYEANVTCLIDVGLKASIPCAIYTGEKAPDGNKEIASKLMKFAEGDFIKVVAFLRPYGVKNGDTWKNSLSIDITQIKNDPPQRKRESKPTDDDIPF
jgi:hypothetical protein